MVDFWLAFSLGFIAACVLLVLVVWLPERHTRAPRADYPNWIPRD